MTWPAQQSVNVGTGPNTGNGDPLRTAFQELNANDATLYSAFTAAGIVKVANGGLGQGATPANGQIPIGTGSGYTPATLTAGANVTITNTAGGIEIASSGGGGSATEQFETVTGNTTLSSGTNAVLVDASAGDITITLPTAIGAEFVCYIKRIDSSTHNVTVATSNSQTIDGNASISIPIQYASVTLLSDNANWWIT